MNRTFFPVGANGVNEVSGGETVTLGGSLVRFGGIDRATMRFGPFVVDVGTRLVNY